MIDKDTAILQAKSFVRRRDIIEYAEAVTRSSPIYGGSIVDLSPKEIERRARYCLDMTDWHGVEMNFEASDAVVISEDEIDEDCWLVGMAIQPIGFEHFDGNATPIRMKISKTTGRISDFWVEAAF